MKEEPGDPGFVLRVSDRTAAAMQLAAYFRRGDEDCATKIRARFSPSSLATSISLSGRLWAAPPAARSNRRRRSPKTAMLHRHGRE